MGYLPPPTERFIVHSKVIGQSPLAGLDTTAHKCSLSHSPLLSQYKLNEPRPLHTDTGSNYLGMQGEILEEQYKK